MSVEEIQNEILQAAEKLADDVEALELGRLMAALEEHHPEDMEAMASDEVCPSVAWEAHGDLGHARELAIELLSTLRGAGGATPDAVRNAWLRRRLRAVEDEAARALFRDLVGLEVEPDELAPEPPETVPHFDHVRDPMTRAVLGAMLRGLRPGQTG